MITIYAESIEGNLAPHTREIEPLNYIYLHGELESMNGFDLAYIDKKDAEFLHNDVDEVISDCKVILAVGKVIDARLYFWRQTEYRSGYHFNGFQDPNPQWVTDRQYHGLIVIPGSDAEEDAKKKCKERRHFI